MRVEVEVEVAEALEVLEVLMPLQQSPRCQCH